MFLDSRADRFACEHATDQSNLNATQIYYEFPREKSIETGESYIEGFCSPHLIRGRMRGYELHATNQRLIGVKNRKVGAGWMIGAGAGGMIGGALAGKMSWDQSERTIREIAAKKDFETLKENVASIELKKPSWIRTGHILVSTRSGETVKIKVGDKGTHEKSLELIRAFYPDSLKLV